MTKIKDKMPVLGKRYKANKYKNDIILVIDASYKHISYKYVLGDGDYSMRYAILADEFWDSFEELPEDNKKGMVRIFPDFAEEPNQPTEALKAEMANEKKEVIAHYHSKKIESKTDMKEECVKAKDIDVPTKSIWKDVSELPEVDHDCIICTNKGKMAFTMYQHTDKNFTYQVDEIDSTVSNRSFNPHKMQKYTTLTDLINSFEQMQKDIAELKRNKLEGK